MSGWAISSVGIWMLGAIAVEVSLNRLPAGSGKINSFRGLWPAGALVGLGLILTGTLGYMLDGFAISGVCFWLILADHLRQRHQSDNLPH